MFKWLTMKNGAYRMHPVTLKTIFCGVPEDPAELVAGRYIYKGISVSREVRRNLKANIQQISQTDLNGLKEYTCTDKGYGESAILLALLNPDVKIKAHMSDEERREVASVSAMDFVNNIEFK